MVSLSLTTFSLFFSDTPFSDPAAIRIQITFFLLSCCCCCCPQDRNCGRKRALMKHCRPAGWHHGNQDLPVSGRAGSQGCLCCRFSISCPVSQNLSDPQRTCSTLSSVSLFSFATLPFFFLPLCTWLIYSLSQGAPHVITAGTGPLKTKADFCSHPCLGLSLQEGTFPAFWRSCCCWRGWGPALAE